jgi:hypothetical protein
MMAYAGKLANCGPFAARQTGNQPDRMIVSGVVVSATAVAVLARCLQRAGHKRLADDVGLALDADWHELVLAPNEEKEILSVLAHCPPVLHPLRDALQARTHPSARATTQRRT